MKAIPMCPYCDKRHRGAKFGQDNYCPTAQRQWTATPLADLTAALAEALKKLERIERRLSGIDEDYFAS